MNFMEMSKACLTTLKFLKVPHLLHLNWRIYINRTIIYRAVFSWAGGSCNESSCKFRGCRWAADPFQEPSQRVCTHPDPKSNQGVLQQTWTLPRENPSTESMRHTQEWPGAPGRANKGKLASQNKMTTVILVCPRSSSLKGDKTDVCVLVSG